MPSPEPHATAPAFAAPAFAALGDRTRLALLERLNDGRPQSIIRLSDGMGLTRQGVTKHLRVLEDAGIVRSTRVGREKRFAYVPESIDDLRTYLDQVAAQWEAALGRLKDFVEQD